MGLGALAAQEPQGEVESFDLTAPAFVDRALAAGQRPGPPQGGQARVVGFAAALEAGHLDRSRLIVRARLRERPRAELTHRAGLPFDRLRNDGVHPPPGPDSPVRGERLTEAR
ncbi:hypothetical protein ACFXI6_51335 [Streptomyces mirabilis]|uniref:hypothetical protein n=1 Tax=Streptomyces mirabilis TaxID=68239 RepID=UPI0036B33169